MANGDVNQVSTVDLAVVNSECALVKKRRYSLCSISIQI